VEDAGVDADALHGQLVGVFAGISTGDYGQLAQRLSIAQKSKDAGGIFLPTGTAHSAAVGRVSYYMDLQGPNMAVDTACSSSLVALDLACNSLRQGKSQLALAGGVNVLLAEEVFILMRGQTDTRAARAAAWLC
jgi:acyl transferase domain-containing protein